MPDFGRWTSNGGDPSLNDINRADRFIEALSSNQPVYSTDPGDAELAFLLADWRDGVRETPSSVTVTEADAVAALAAATAPHRGNRRTLAVVGSAAAAVLCVGGFGAAVYGAGPGDGLYGLRTMFFGEQQATRDDQVVLAAQQELAQVQQLVEQGQWDQAQDKLATLSSTVQSVEQVERKHDLIEQWNALTYKVVEQDPAATLPPVGEPLPPLPDAPLTLLPLPALPEPGATSTSSSMSSSTSSSSPGETTSLPGETTTSTSEVTPSPSDVPSTTLPGTTLPSTTLPSTTLPGTTLPSSTVPSATPSTPATTPPPASTPAATPPPSSATRPPATSTTTVVSPTTTTTVTQAPAAQPPAAPASPVAPPVQTPTLVQEQQQAPEREQKPAREDAPVTTVILPGGGQGNGGGNGGGNVGGNGRG